MTDDLRFIAKPDMLTPETALIVIDIGENNPSTMTEPVGAGGKGRKGR